MEPGYAPASYARLMGSRVLRGAWIATVVGYAVAAGAGPSPARTKITIWGTPTPTVSLYGGQAYGGYAPTTGAMISEQREVEVGAAEVRIPGVAATLDPASVQLRDLTDPAATITQQRFVPGATTPTEMLQRSLGAQLTVVTPRGELTGVLRSADEQTLVLELGTGDQRRLQVMRRDGFVQAVRLPPGSGVDTPSLVVGLATRRPGRHAMELTYRADGLSWHADYLAVLDDRARTVDFSAWATVRNATGATFTGAELTLVTGGNSGPLPTNPYGGGVATRPAPAPAPIRYAVPTPVHLAAGQAVQVELLPAQRHAKVRTVVTFQAMTDPGSPGYPNTDCSHLNGIGMGNGRAELALELDIPSKDPLPEGRVRAFRRTAERLEVVSEDQLRSSAGVARVRLAADNDIVGERRAVTCTYDERARTILEKIEVRVDNKSRRATDVVIREFAWRWSMWRLDGEDTKSVRAGPQTLEYRTKVPAGGKRTVTYAIVYSW